MADSLKKKTFKGTIWSAIDSFSVQGIQFLVMLVMARILSPSDYGILGMISIFIAISGTLINSGFSQALMRKINRTQTDCSTVFFFNIVASTSLYFVLFFCAPFIARFYNMPILTPVTRVVGLNFILGSFCIVQNMQFSIRLDFKTTAKASLSAAILSGIAGIASAYMGFGVWALVIQQLVSAITRSFLLWYFSKWRPSFEFSWKSLKELFGFGSKMMISGLLDTGYGNMYSLVIGKVFNAADLGFYTRAKGFGQFASSNITSIIQRVSFPVLCNIQEDDARLRDGYRRILRVSAFIIFPLMVGMAAVAKPMVITLVTEKWLFAAVLLVPVCFNLMWYPVHAINLNLLQVKGRSDLFLKLEIIKKIIAIAVLVISIPFGLLAMVWFRVGNSILALVINTHYTGKLLNLGFFIQMKDLFPILLLSLAMGAVVWLTVSTLALSSMSLLIIGVLEGAVVYIGLAKLFRFPEFKEVTSLLKDIKKRT